MNNNVSIHYQMVVRRSRSKKRLKSRTCKAKSRRRGRKHKKSHWKKPSKTTKRTHRLRGGQPPAGPPTGLAPRELPLPITMSPLTDHNLIVLLCYERPLQQGYEYWQHLQRK